MTENNTAQSGRVVVWNCEDGIGEAELDDGRRVWIHYSSIQVPGALPGEYRALVEGQRIEIDVEEVQQDGFTWRATRARGLSS